MIRRLLIFSEEGIFVQILETIQRRRSVRAYEERELTDLDREKVEGVIESVIPLVDGQKKEWQILPRSRQGSCRIGAIIHEKEIHDRIELGFQGEQIVLGLTHLGLGTLWVGGAPKPGMPAHIVCGYPKEEGLMSKVLNLFTKGGAKRPMEHLTGSVDPIPPSLIPVLEAGRNSPSAMNKQPWRFSVHNVHALSVRSSKPIELGIVLCHLIFTAQALFDDVTWTAESTEVYRFTLGEPKEQNGL